MKPLFLLGDRQREVLELLWGHGDQTVNDLASKLPGLAYTTILSTLQGLEAQGWVGHRREGKAHRYRARLGRDEARRHALGAFGTLVYGGDTAALARDLRPPVTSTLKAWVQRRQAAA